MYARIGLKNRYQILTYLILLTLLFLTYSTVIAEPNEPLPNEDLFDMDIEELLDVEVSVASKKTESTSEAPGVVVVVPRDEFVIYGDRNLHQLMQRQPSIYTRDNFVYSDNLAAFRGDMSTVAEMHTLILFNGRPIRESAQGHNVNMYMTFPLESLESVELIRGPGSVLYGSNAFTGVVNLKTRVPDSNELSVSTRAGTYGYYDSTVTSGGKSDEFRYITTVRAAGQQGYRYRMFDQASNYGVDNNHNKSVSGVTHLEYGNFSFDFFGSDMEAFALGVQPLWSNPHSYIRNKKMFVNLGYQIPMHERLTVELNATYNLQENSLSSPAPMMIGTNTSDLLGEVTVFANPTDNLNAVGGFLQESRRNYHPEDDHFQSIPSYDYEPQSAYVQGDYKIGKAIKLIAGTQWNESPLGDSDLVSRYGVIFTPIENWGLKLLRGEAFRGPVTLESDLFDPTILVGNKNLEPETITTYDVQLFYNSKKTYAAITYFNSIIKDLIIYDASVTPMSYMNGGEQKFDGIEFEAKHFISSNWHVLGSFMYQNDKADAGLNPSVVPDIMAKMGTGYSWDGGSASIFYIYFAKPPTIASPVVVNPGPEAIHLVTTNVRLDVSKHIGLKKGQSILTLRAENIFNEKIYVPTFAYTGQPNSFPYGPGATFYAGLTLRN